MLTLSQRLKKTYWPTSSADDPLDTARRRCLISFSILGALCSLAIGFTYFNKNFVVYPAQGATILVTSALLFLSPYFIVRCKNIAPPARIIIGLAFIVLALMSASIDGVISFKAILLLPLAMVTTLTLGARQGIFLGIAMVALFFCLHLGRENIGGNISTPLSVGELSYLMAVSLTFCLTFIVTGAAIFRAQMQTTLRKLDKASRLAEASSKAKSQFLALMSHEIRTPLHGILGMNELLASSKLDMEQDQYVSTVRESASNLLTLLNDVLDFSQSENGEVRITSSKFDLRRMIEGIACQFSIDADRRGLDLVVDFPADIDDEWFGDADRIRQIVSNLVGNALKYTQRGHIEIVVEVNAQTSHPVIRVTDTGIGFDEKYKELIFEHFTQLNDDKDQSHPGTGLGLAICRSLARAMGGEVSVTSAPARGSSFSLTLALQSCGRKAAEQYVTAPDSTVLVIDSLTASHRISRDMLSQLYSQVLSANSLEDAGLRCEQAAIENTIVSAIVVNADAMPISALADWYAEMTEQPVMKHATLVLAVRGDSQQLRQKLPSELANAQVLRKPLSLSALAYSLNEKNSSQPAADLENSAASLDSDNCVDRLSLRPRLLIAEDNEVNRMFLKHFLKRKSVDVVFAENGATAIEAARAQAFDLVVMDVEMPIVNGVEATQAIRRFERINQRRRTNIVAVTASALAGDRDRFLAAGMDDYLAKPYKIEDFDSMLSRWLPGGLESADA